MPTATLPNRSSFVAPVERAPDAPSASSPVGFLTSSPAVVAHRAVDAVMTAVDRFSAGERHAVSMRFSVGGTDLSVCVEMHGDQVRTTFRTDSPELRGALAQEWQAAGAESGDRSLRVAAPVFTSNDGANSNAFSGDTSSRQRDSRARRGDAEDIFSVTGSRSSAGATFAVTNADLPVSADRAFVSGTALHLSTLA